MNFIDHLDWWELALAAWFVVSLLSLPLVGRFLAGALHQPAYERQHSVAPRDRSERGRGLASGGLPAPSSQL